MGATAKYLPDIKYDIWEDPGFRAETWYYQEEQIDEEGLPYEKWLPIPAGKDGKQKTGYFVRFPEETHAALVHLWFSLVANGEGEVKGAGNAVVGRRVHRHWEGKRVLFVVEHRLSLAHMLNNSGHRCRSVWGSTSPLTASSTPTTTTMTIPWRTMPPARRINGSASRPPCGSSPRTPPPLGSKSRCSPVPSESCRDGLLNFQQVAGHGLPPLHHSMPSLAPCWAGLSVSHPPSCFPQGRAALPCALPSPPRSQAGLPKCMTRQPQLGIVGPFM